jgi:hypothetical protein
VREVGSSQTLLIVRTGKPARVVDGAGGAGGCNMQIVKERGKRTMLAIMQHGDGVALDHSLKTVAQCGMIALELLQIPFNGRFELLGVNAAMLKLRKDL